MAPGTPVSAHRVVRQARSHLGPIAPPVLRSFALIGIALLLILVVFPAALVAARI